jgi:DNA-binding NarL/FixJ family response regulator
LNEIIYLTLGTLGTLVTLGTFMAKNIKTHIFCYDDHRGFSEDVRKRFQDSSRYKVLSFPTREEFLSHIEAERESNFCKIAILGLHDNKEQIAMIDRLTQDIKKCDRRPGLILLGPEDKMEEIKKTVKYNIDAYIPRNANSILRIHNTVKKLISEHSIGVFRKRRNISLYVLLTFIILSALTLLVVYFRAPQYF